MLCYTHTHTQTHTYSLYKDTERNCLSKALPLNTKKLGIRFQHVNFGETNIQSIVIIFYVLSLQTTLL